MDLPPKMKEMLDDESPDFQKMFQSVYENVEALGLTLHPQGSPNVITKHPKNGTNFVALWIKGRKGSRWIMGEVRVDGCKVDILSSGMSDEITIHKYDRDKKPLWCSLHINEHEDINKLCLIARRVISIIPNWGTH